MSLDTVVNNPLAGRYAGTDITVKQAAGAVIQTTEGETAVDYILGNLTQLRGFRSVASLLGKIEELDLPLNVGDYPHEIQSILASKLTVLAQKDTLRFTNSGSEAIHLAVRVARAQTKRQKIVRFFGHYHGWYAEEIAGVVPATYSEGLASDVKSNLIQLEWNDFDGLRETFENYGGEIACIMCEPVLAHSGTIPPKEGFLESIVDLARKNGSISVFDECITGFRVGLTGAQGHFGIHPDMVVYSKAISSGVPFGVLLGSHEHMEPLTEGRVFHASTYDGNMVSVLACLETLKELETGEAYVSIGRAQDALTAGLAEQFAQAGLSYCYQHAPGFFQFYFTDKTSIDDYSAAQATDIPLFRRFVAGMRDNGVRISEGDLSHQNPNQNWLGSWFLSSAHKGTAVERTLEACQSTLRTL